MGPPNDSPMRSFSSESNLAQHLKPCLLESTIPLQEKVEGNFGGCSLAFESGGPASFCFELGHLIISFNSSKSTSAADTARLLSTLDRVFSSELDFAVSCDLRKGQPSPSLAMSIGRFLHDNQERLARHVVSMALLIRRNIFVACAQGVIGSILNMWFPSCPAIVCHCEHIASEFFMAHTSWSAIGREFVSVVKVRQDGLDMPDATILGKTSYCNAFVVPLLPWGASNIGSTLHVLPNGDLRVIQSPAVDIIRGTEKAMHSNADDDSSSTLSSALKFEGTERDLAKLIGAHFHIGELIADADIESQNRHETCQSPHSNHEPQGCWDDALRMMGQICASALMASELADRKYL